MNYKTNMNHKEIGGYQDGYYCFWDEPTFKKTISEDQAIKAFQKTILDKLIEPYNIEQMVELFKANLNGEAL